MLYYRRVVIHWRNDSIPANVESIWKLSGRTICIVLPEISPHPFEEKDHEYW